MENKVIKSEDHLMAFSNIYPWQEDEIWHNKFKGCLFIYDDGFVENFKKIEAHRLLQTKYAN